MQDDLWRMRTGRLLFLAEAPLGGLSSRSALLWVRA
jgi:hypothetical protein